MSKAAELGSLKEGSWINIDGEPCQVVEVAHSKTGKHGSAKVRLVAMGLFDGVKRTVMNPVTARVEVPVIEKRSGQVISMAGSTLQLMDLETYEVFESPVPTDQDLAKRVAPGVAVEYWRVLRKGLPSTIVMRTKGA